MGANIQAMKRYVPNVLTLLNLASGSIGVILTLKDNLIYGALCINLGALFDFLDGLLARSFCYASDFGKHLDSLADLISFGFLPSVIMYTLIELQTHSLHLPYMALLITLFSALRLARFNLDDAPLETFVGLPTPANAIFISTLPFMMTDDHHSWLSTCFTHTYTLVGTVIISSILLMTNIPFMGLKFTTYAWHPNRTRYILLLTGGLLITLLRVEGIILSFFLYVLYSGLSQHLIKENFK
ncbi:MAG: CDP-diacylglycerol--serine O-phosphatidyltransferase [Bacteroidota bacterium]